MHGCGNRHHHAHHRREAHRAAVDEPLVPADDLRASDAERERVVVHLRDQAGEGRLTVEELDERLERTYAARTRKELAALTHDLPRPRRIHTAAVAARDAFAEHLRSYLLVMALLVGIWAVTGMGYFWPVWPAMGWGIGLVSHWSAARRVPRARLTAPPRTG